MCVISDPLDIVVEFCNYIFSSQHWIERDVDLEDLPEICICFEPWIQEREDFGISQWQFISQNWIITNFYL